MQYGIDEAGMLLNNRAHCRTEYPVMVTHKTLLYTRGSLIFVVALLLGAQASAGSKEHNPKKDFKVFDLVVDEVLFHEVADCLQMTVEQRGAAHAAWEKYYTSAKEADEAAYQRAMDAGIQAQREFDEARLSRGEQLDFHASRRIGARGAREWRLGWRQGDKLLDSFLNEVAAILTPVQEQEMESARRLIRRRCKLAIEDPSSTLDNFRGYWDLHRLVDRAADVGGELQEIYAESASAAALELRQQIDAIVHRVDLAIDDLLKQAIAESRELPPDYAQMTDDEIDEDDRRRFTDVRKKRWAIGYEVFSASVNEIAALLETRIGADARSQWQERWDVLFCPNLVAQRYPDLIKTWFDGLSDVTSEQRDAVDAEYAEYLRKRCEIRQAAIQAGVAVKKRYYFISAGTEPEQLHYARQLLRLEQLHKDFVDRVRSILPSENTAALQQQMKSLTRSNMYELISPLARQILTGAPLPQGGVLLPVPVPSKPDQANTNKEQQRQ
jgi:hypothetical protein